MIETVRFKNFKALRDVTIPLERFTVLVGPNASGKTSVLQGLDYLFFLRHADRGYFSNDRGLQVLRSSGAPNDSEVEIQSTGAWLGKPGSIDLALFEIDDFRAMWSMKAAHGDQSLQLDESPSSKKGPRHGAILDELTTIVDLLRFDAGKLAEPAYSDTRVPRIEPDGAGLAAVLAEMLISRPDDFRRIEQALQAVIPSVTRVRLERTPIKRSELQQITINGQTTTSTSLREYVGHCVVFDMQGAPNLPSHGASEGTLITLGILTVILSHQGPHLVLIDDVERAIHPKAIAALIAQLRQILALFPELQIIATSHSPDLVDQLDPGEVRLMIADETGAVKCARLSDHPQFDRWAELMRPGEIWSMIGEEWIHALGV